MWQKSAFLKTSGTESPIFCEMKEGFKVSFVKIIHLLIVVKEGTNKLFFFIFQYGAEYYAECRAESGAK